MKRKELQWPIINALQNLGGQQAHHRSKIRDFIIQDLGLTTAQIDARSGAENRKIFNRETSTALSYLAKHGYLENVARGYWKLTPQGQQAISSQFPI